MTDTIRAALARLISASAAAWGSCNAQDKKYLSIEIARAREALAQPEPEVVADGPAVPEGREPASVVGEPSDEELLELTEDWPATSSPRHDLSGCPEVPLYSVFADEVIDFARAALAGPVGDQAMPPRVGHVLRLAEIIREVDGNHDKGAAALAEAILSHPGIRSAGLASVVGEPSNRMPTLNAIMQLADNYFTFRGNSHGDSFFATSIEANKDPAQSIYEFARAVLARYGRPAPAPPAAGEVGELVAWLREQATWFTADDPGHENYDRAADLLEQRHSAPVPVSERLPGPKDCDAEHYCWRWNTIGGLWARQPLARSWYEFESHWLPATALPLPQGEVQP